MIFLSAGHNPRAKGASFGSDNEYDLACVWVETIRQLLSEGGVEVTVVPTGGLGSKVRYINEHCTRDDVALEIHFNSSANRRGHGSETLYCPGSVRGKALADIIQRVFLLMNLFQPDRGAKEGWYHGSNGKKLLYFVKETHCPAVIIEPEFIFNIDTLRANQDAGCDAIVSALLGHLGVDTC